MNCQFFHTVNKTCFAVLMHIARCMQYKFITFKKHVLITALLDEPLFLLTPQHLIEPKPQKDLEAKLYFHGYAVD